MTLIIPPGQGRRQLDDDPSWYQTAVFYEVLVRGFADSNGDGTGDIRGVVDRAVLRQHAEEVGDVVAAVAQR